MNDYVYVWQKQDCVGFHIIAVFDSLDAFMEMISRDYPDGIWITETHAYSKSSILKEFSKSRYETEFTEKAWCSFYDKHYRPLFGIERIKINRKGQADG